MTTMLVISALTNLVVTVKLLHTHRRLNKVQRMFKIYVRTRQSPRQTVIARNPAPWEIR